MNKDGQVIAPIDLGDVVEVLGEDKLDVGCLCKSSKINKWAKYKPFDYNKVEALAEEEYYDNNYGFKTPSPNTNLDATKDNVYEYMSPTGGEDSPYRLTDFENYYHLALPPIAAFGDVALNSILSEDYTFYNKQLISKYSLSVGDFKVLAGKYICLALIGKNSTIYKTSSKQIMQGGSMPEVTITTSELRGLVPSNIREYYLCVCYLKKESFYDTGDANLFLPLPFEDVNEVSGKFTITTDFPLSFKLLRISAKNNFEVSGGIIGFPMHNAETYYKPLTEEQLEDDNYYYDVSSTYTLSYEVNVTNSSDSNVVISTNMLGAELSGTFAGAVDFDCGFKQIYLGNILLPDIYKITINARETVKLVLCLPDMVFTYNQKGISVWVTAGQKKSIALKLTYSGSGVVASTLALRLRN